MGSEGPIRVGAVVTAVVAVIAAVAGIALALPAHGPAGAGLSAPAGAGVALPPVRASSTVDVPAPARVPRPVRVLPLGDSITWGQGSPTESSYRAPLWQMVAGQSRFSIRFVGEQLSGDLPEPANEGHRGYTIDQIAQNVDVWMAAARPDVVILHIGINDLAKNLDVPGAPDRLAVLVNRIYRDRPGVSVVFMGLLPTTPGLGPQVAVYNARAAALERAERQAGRSFSYVTPPALTSTERVDRLHPNDTGYRLIAQAIFPVLSRTVADREATRTVQAAAR
jgi:lysophospholipase L1-like esterase